MLQAQIQAMQDQIDALQQQLAAAQMGGAQALQVQGVQRAKKSWDLMKSGARREAVKPAMNQIKLIAEERGARPEQISAHITHR